MKNEIGRKKPRRLNLQKKQMNDGDKEKMERTGKKKRKWEGNKDRKDKKSEKMIF